MKKLLRWVRKQKWWLALGVGVLLFVIGGPLLLAAFTTPSSNTHTEEGGRLMTVYDKGQTVSFLSKAETLGEALAEKDIQLEEHDAIEPSLDEKLIAPEYRVNIYRARPITIIDGAVRTRTVTAYQTPERIAKSAGMNMFAEDTAVLKQATDFDHSGVGLQLTITRATPVALTLHGAAATVRTQAKTVGDMLTEKKISLGAAGRVAPAEGTPIAANMQVRVWREGQQTITVSEAVEVSARRIFDADREIGYQEVQVPGVPGVRMVTYEVNIKDGVELSRRKLSELVTKPATQEVIRVGVKPNGRSLTKSKGAQVFVDSKGVAHRETYYDLDMRVVMGACGQRGVYTVRPDGVKIDADGYIIIAAHLGRYPRCSVVETSMGPGKVYDTGGFVAHHPDGFDLATDWTNYNGR